jgi:predicted phosphohydrolase
MSYLGFDAILNRREPSVWERFWSSPVKTIAKALYSLLEPVIPVPANGISVVCVSDTHNTQPKLPHGDILLHAGDLTQSGSFEELKSQIEWLDSQTHTFKVVIAGNHDLSLDPSKTPTRGGHKPEDIDWRSLVYLRDSATTLRFPGARPVKIYGSPWTPKHGNWVFQYAGVGTNRWEGAIPEDTDILLTHGPPKCHLDLDDLGCPYLLDEVKKKRPVLHVFGHIHAGYGQREVLWDSFESAYEEAIGKGGSWLGLGRMIIYMIPRIRNCSQRGTVLVNAAAVGGFRDEHRREPITVIV